MSLESWMIPEEKWARSWAPLPIPPKEPVAISPVCFIEPQVSKEDLEYFRTNGYWVAPKMISDEEIARLRKEMEGIYIGEVDTQATPYEYEYYKKVLALHHQKSHKVMKVNNAWWINKTIRSVSTSSSIGHVAAQLLGTDEIRLWHDQAIWKPGTTTQGLDPNEGNIGWHQDYGFWQISNSPEMITAWVALQDTDLNNGAMRTITGSHKWGLLPDSATFFDKDMEKLKERFTIYGNWRDEPCVMKAGQVAFHHALTLHGSGPNLTEVPRMAIAVHMMSKNCAYQSGKGWHHNLRDMGPDVKDGDLFVGPAFPVLYKE